jgi:hypothetical protein
MCGERRMPMIDMKLTKEEKKDRNGSLPVDTAKDTGPEYPYGLVINLDKESLKKLKVKTDDYNTGEYMSIKAKVKVVGISSRTSFGNGGDYETMELQITEMELEK